MGSKALVSGTTPLVVAVSAIGRFISGYCFIQAAMLRMCFGLIFAGLAVASNTAHSEEGSFTHDLDIDILTIQLVNSDADRLNTNVALTRSKYNAPARSGMSNTPRLHLVAEPKKEAVWPENANWQIDSRRASLSPLLRFESNGERIEIKPRRHSVSFVWRKALPF